MLRQPKKLEVKADKHAKRLAQEAKDLDSTRARQQKTVDMLKKEQATLTEELKYVRAESNSAIEKAKQELAQAQEARAGADKHAQRLTEEAKQLEDSRARQQETIKRQQDVIDTFTKERHVLAEKNVDIKEEQHAPKAVTDRQAGQVQLPTEAADKKTKAIRQSQGDRDSAKQRAVGASVRMSKEQHTIANPERPIATASVTQLGRPVDVPFHTLTSSEAGQGGAPVIAREAFMPQLPREQHADLVRPVEPVVVRIPAFQSGVQLGGGQSQYWHCIILKVGHWLRQFICHVFIYQEQDKCFMGQLAV